VLGFLHFRMGKLEGVIIERENERASERERERKRERERERGGGREGEIVYWNSYAVSKCNARLQ